MFALAGAPPVRIKAVHPRPPVNRAAAPQWRARSRRCRAPTSSGDVQILAGDFNATLDHPELRALLDRGYPTPPTRPVKGGRPTWPARPGSAARSR